MEDVYNKAIQYLNGKYGYKRIRKTIAFDKKYWGAPNNTKRKELEDNATDRDYITAWNQPTDHDGKMIELLIKQYHYGEAPKKELESVLTRLGVE
jgi:hypothetical protein